MRDSVYIESDIEPSWQAVCAEPSLCSHAQVTPKAQAQCCTTPAPPTRAGGRLQHTVVNVPDETNLVYGPFPPVISTPATQSTSDLTMS